MRIKESDFSGGPKSYFKVPVKLSLSPCALVVESFSDYFLGNVVEVSGSNSSSHV